MAAHCRRVGLALRPHAKTHKSVRIARLQLDAGAIGICCATIGEAELLCSAGISGVLVTSPVVQPANIQRLVRLAEGGRVMAVVDDAGNLRALSAAAAAAGARLPLLVDFDIGLGRTGCATLESAVELARLARALPGVLTAGVQGYAGHLQHVEAFAARRELAAGQAAKMAELVAALGAEGLAPGIVSGGGTGTHDIDHGGVFTELQAGSYTVMDVEYGEVELTAASTRPVFEAALFVRTTVVSANAKGMATTDAGLKRFATDGPRPRIARGAPEGAVYGFSGDEHGCVVFSDASGRLEVGAALECIVPHCDPTVNLYDHYHCVRGDELVDIWPVDARGAY